MRKNPIYIFVIIILSLGFIMEHQIKIARASEIQPFSSQEMDVMEDLDFNEVKPNESGQIMILMYHGIDKKRATANYQRTVKGFKEDLQKLYDNNYRLIKIEDLINNNIKVEAGCTPVILTFDDALSSSFSLEEKDGELVPTKDCAVDIINEFCEEYPNFGKGGIFFISGKGRPPFFGKGEMKDRFQYLLDNGYEIGNHTFSHLHLYGLSEEKIQEEIAKMENFVKEVLPEMRMLCIAYPYGERPKKNMRQVAICGEFGNITYNYKIALREGQSGASANPNHINFDPLNIPRVRGTNNAKMDLGWCIKYYNQHPEARYISDGNPNTISVPLKYIQNINMESLGEKELIIYE